MALAAARDDIAIRRLRLRVSGTVQGVGFRPFAHALASEMGLSGFVLNDNTGVLIEVEGPDTQRFAAEVRRRAPPLARIDRVEIEELDPVGEAGFSILESRAGKVATRIGPDAATCPQCLDELFDPTSRFFRYPFINCTNCGPRFTIARSLPYDRARTAMAGFAMCGHCKADYEDIASRRFHAEAIACPQCGPQLSHEVEDIAAAVASGKIVSLKGIGGFHLICNASDPAAIAELRRRKARDEKPFAVMVRDLDTARGLALMCAEEEALLESSARPVVLAESRGLLPDEIAPGLRRVGLMLAYAPVHHLLLAALEPMGIAAIVATSANPGGEPLVCGNEEAQQRLAGIADLVVTHDRDIVVRADDSVMQIVAGAPAFLRRARGFVPDPIDLGGEGPDVIAFGGDLKNTVCVTRGREAFVSQHVGGLDNSETIRFLSETVSHLCSILDVQPDLAACDLHPDFRSVRLAEDSGLPLVRVQHHVAHIAAVAVEHHLSGPVLGLALDGYGYGPGGEVWGGELIRLDGCRWRQMGGLVPLPMPGGDRAAREPWRMALSALHAAGRPDLVAALWPDHLEAGHLSDMLDRGMKAPLTSSMGRLFDAVAAIAGFPAAQSFEGQAAMRLEALAGTLDVLDGGFEIRDGRLDFRPLVVHIAEKRLQGRQAAALFHGTVVAGLAEWVARAGAASGIRRVALGGGCFMNRVLAEGLLDHLTRRGFEVYLPRLVPANDGGLSLGQAAFARQAVAMDRSLVEEV